MAVEDASQTFPIRALLVAAIVTVVVSLAGIWLMRGSVPFTQVNVEWRPDVPELEQQRVAAQLSLYLRRIEPPNTWICMLADSSTTNIAAILSHPAIARVRFLDRDTLRPTEFRTTSPASWIDARYPWIGPIERRARWMGVVPVFATALLLILAGTTSGRQWLVARVPAISPVTLGVFRIVLALGLWATVLATVPGPPYRLPCLALLALFLIGAAPRLAFVAFVIAFTAAHRDALNHHDLALPIKTLWLLMLVPWGAGLSVDEFVRRRLGKEPHVLPSRLYGLAVWLPVLMLGLAYAAAAFAKFDETGIGWITRGAVRYFFVIDTHNAPAGLGRVIASSDALSVVFSAGAILSEMSVLLAAIWPGTLLTLLAGCVALALHGGFYLFQQVWWPAWWALLPAFLPWESIVTGARTRFGYAPARQPGIATAGPAAAAQWSASITAVIVFLAVVQQPVASLLRTDYSFLISDFPMYSDLNYASKEAYAAFADAKEQPPPLIAFHVPDDDDAVFESRLQRVDPTASLIGAVQTLARGGELSSSETSTIKEVAARYRQAFGSAPPRVDVLATPWHFDWTVARFVPVPDGKRLAMLDLSSGLLER